MLFNVHFVYSINPIKKNPVDIHTIHHHAKPSANPLISKHIWVWSHGVANQDWTWANVPPSNWTSVYKTVAFFPWLYRGGVGVLRLDDLQRGVAGEADLPVGDVRGHGQGQVQSPPEARADGGDGGPDVHQLHTVQLEEQEGRGGVSGGRRGSAATRRTEDWYQPTAKLTQPKCFL